MTAPVTHEVSGCAECLFRQYESTECSHPSMVDKLDRDVWDHGAEGSGAPSWCPLREAPVLVTLKVRA